MQLTALTLMGSNGKPYLLSRDQGNQVWVKIWHGGNRSRCSDAVIGIYNN